MRAYKNQMILRDIFAILSQYNRSIEIFGCKLPPQTLYNKHRKTRIIAISIVKIRAFWYDNGMGSDLFALNALAKELDSALKGARIDKIQQPETDELRFFMRSKGKNVCLVASCNAGAPRIHLTQSKKQSPLVAPNLCMLMRKYLLNAIVDSVGIYNFDRIVYVKFNAKTEMRDDADFYVFVEIMNRYSNIVFTDENLIILDAVKHLPLDVARDHVVLRGVKYSPVTQKKISYLTKRFEVFDNFTGGDLHKFIQDNISGFSGATINEILLRANLDCDVAGFSEQQRSRLEKVICDFADMQENAIDSVRDDENRPTADSRSSLEPQPCVINDKEVYPVVYRTLANADGSNVTEFNSMSEAYDALTTDCDKEIRNKARLKSLATIAKRLHQKIEKNIAIDLQRLKECEDMDTLKLYGELIVSNIYRIKKGDESVKCFNYYDNTEVVIPLDARLTPSKNSTAYYTKYNKLKRAKEFVSKKLVEDRDLLEYVKSIEEEIASLPYESQTTAIEEELDMLGGTRKKSQKNKVRRERPEPPFVYEIDGFTVYRGKNNLQNDELTFKIASSNDIWMHIKNEHGAHTIIVTDGRQVPDNVLKIAGEITASTKQANVEVDYTERRNVKRKPDGHPGQVIYVGYKTLVAAPNAHKELQK